jgi:diamine N-acetyltransferase
MTNDVSLRAMEPEDLDLLYRIENDPQLWGVSASNVPYSRYTLHDYIAHSSGNIYIDGQVRLMIENEAHDVVGIADVVNFDAKHRRAELGLVIERQHRHKGYAQKAISLIANYALSVLHLHQIYVIVSADNIAPIKLFQKLGFTKGNMLKEWLYDGKNYTDALMMQKIL